MLSTISWSLAGSIFKESMEGGKSGLRLTLFQTIKISLLLSIVSSIVRLGEGDGRRKYSEGLPCQEQSISHEGLRCLWLNRLLRAGWKLCGTNWIGTKKRRWSRNYTIIRNPHPQIKHMLDLTSRDCVNKEHSLREALSASQRCNEQFQKSERTSRPSPQRGFLTKRALIH